MKNLETFLNTFFEAEAEILEAYKQPDIEKYNAKVVAISDFVAPELKNSFGAIINSKMGKDFYERAKKMPLTIPRHLYRIDLYETTSKHQVFLCMVSSTNPDDDWKEVSDLLIVTQTNGSHRIEAKFFLNDSEMIGHPVWNSGGGKTDYEKIVKGEYLLNEKSLGKRISIKRLMEPIDDEISMIIYNNDEI